MHPDQFAAYEQMGLEMGFGYVASGPLVRSSYKTGEFFISQFIDAQRSDSGDEGDASDEAPPIREHA